MTRVWILIRLALYSDRSGSTLFARLVFPNFRTNAVHIYTYYNPNTRMNIHPLYCTVLHELILLFTEALSKAYMNTRWNRSFQPCVHVCRRFNRCVSEPIYILMYALFFVLIRVIYTLNHKVIIYGGKIHICLCVFIP